MSLRPNRYHLAIGARIVLTRYDAEPQRLRLIALPPTPSARPAAIDDALAGLPRSAVPALDTLDVSLGFPHVHHAVLPWQDAILTPDERKVYAEAVLGEDHGFQPGWRADWHCTLAQEAFGEASIASAMRREIVDGIASAAKRHRLRLRVIRPLLIDTIQAVADGPRSLPADAVFIARGPQACEFAFRRDARWLHAFSLPRGAQTSAECLLSAALLAQCFPANIFTDGSVNGDADDARNCTELYAGI